MTTDTLSEKHEVDARPGYLSRVPIRTLLEEIRVASYDAALLDMREADSQDPADLKIAVLANVRERVDGALRALEIQREVDS